MARWIAPETQRIKSNVTWALVIAWGVAGFLSWTRFGWSFYPANTASQYSQLLTVVGILVGGLCISILFASKLIGMVFGWKYKPMDDDRVGVAVSVDQQRIAQADRRAQP